MPANVRVIKSGDWDLALQILGRQSRGGFARALQVTLVQEGHFFRNKMVGGIRSGAPAGQAFAAHSPLTLVVRRGSGRGGGAKILIQSGGMLASITVVESGGTVFVGVKRGSGAGSSRADIAAIHEGGKAFSQVWTDRQRRFFFAMLRQGGGTPRPGSSGGGSGTTVQIRIPARPFVGPVVEKWGKETVFQKRFTERLAKNLGGDLGHI